MCTRHLWCLPPRSLGTTCRPLPRSGYEDRSPHSGSRLEGISTQPCRPKAERLVRARRYHICSGSQSRRGAVGGHCDCDYHPQQQSGVESEDQRQMGTAGCTGCVTRKTFGRRKCPSEAPCPGGQCSCGRCSTPGRHRCTRLAFLAQRSWARRNWSQKSPWAAICSGSAPGACNPRPSCMWQNHCRPQEVGPAVAGGPEAVSVVLAADQAADQAAQMGTGRQACRIAGT